ncbi:PAQR family membrane homeostasis protein TrhA [Persicirhabdus sediminis]|uniref:Hemolysin III family protein n=1 Tax=Persicirhabdus sediminis TaxID=454144 RepID=A0A8J7ME30_9BACT|nr:hemolysin III family protein [Persicirhabdus sediminis]MBK1790144.1 hemolysin III family protein [Persicirhabdus sediminis]
MKMTSSIALQYSELCDSPAEERASMLTHAFGVALSLVGLVGMLTVTAGDVFRIVSASIFGATLILLYLASTLYHSFKSHKLKSIFQTIDHACIYLLIAGSYTPLTLVSLRGTWGWSLFGTVWALAATGVIIKTCFKGRKDSWASTALYLLMGWLVVIAMKPVIDALPAAGLSWLVAGGLCYSAGIIFYAWEKLRFNHAIWHLFVLGGSACHVVATWAYILPNG